MLQYSNIKKIFAICYVPNWFEEVFVIKKVKNSVPWTYVISSVKCSVLAHLKSQPRGQNFQAQI